MTAWSHLPTIFKQRWNLQNAGLISICVVLITTLLFGYVAHAAPGVNKTLTFQGRLLTSTGSVVADGNYNMQFKIYQDGDAQGTGSSLEWTEDYLNDSPATGVEVTNGYFSVNLGSKVAFGSSVDWNQDTLWLSMNIAGTGNCSVFTSCSPDGEMKPMRRITSTPMAMNSGAVGGKTADQLVQLGQGIQTDSGSASSIAINKTGSGDLLQLQNTGTDVLRVASSGDVIFGNDADHSITVSQAASGIAGRDLIMNAGQGGSGSGSNGGDVIINGGIAGGTNASGGNIVLSGGTGSGTGTGGLVILGTPTFSTVTNDTNCYTSGALVATSCTLATGSVDGSAAIIVGFSTDSKSVTVPDPSNTTAGRVIYIMAADTSHKFNLSLNGGGAGNTYSMVENTATTLMWNGSDWVVAGTSQSNAFMGNTDADGTLANIQIGSGSGSGSPTLLTLDKASANPTVTNTSAMLGSMYYDTTLGKIQCYQSNGWGDCASAPDTFVTLSPQFPNAVINGSGIGGTISTDFCSNTLAINDGSSGQPDVCGTNETYNFYKWSSSETTDQTKSIYVSYQLPSNFKNFADGTLSLMGKTNDADATVKYQLYKDHPGSSLATCGTEKTVSTGTQTTWQKVSSTGTDDPKDCSFAAGDSLLVRINVISKNNKNAYVSNLNFVYSNNN